MVSTFNHNPFSVIIDGTVASVQPGLAVLGNALVPWNGAREPLENIVTFTGDSSVFKNSLMYLKQGNPPDTTYAMSSESSNYQALGWPSMPDSSGMPLAVFTFYTSDGVTPQLISYRKP